MTLCGHLKPNTYPLKLELLIDAELTWTDALFRCDQCGRHYLLEMLDQRNHEQLFRISMPEANEVDALLRDLNRGSCDLSRAAAELHSLRSRSPFLPCLLWLDSRKPAILSLPDVSVARLPSGSWRSLPCNGSWFDQLRL